MKETVSARTKISAFIILILIPITLYLGIKYLGDRKYMFISMLIILQVMLPFFMIFEERLPKTREMMLIAVLTAIGASGRMAFFWIPQFKPMVAVAIISGIALGAETGFLVGALIAFTSNFFYGQGPWTPWQMFATGIIGFLSGLLFNYLQENKNKLVLKSIIFVISIGIIFAFIYWIVSTVSSGTFKNTEVWGLWQIILLGIIIILTTKIFKIAKKSSNKLILGTYGFIVTFIVYGGIMDPASVIMFSATVNKKAILAAYISGIPFNLVHGIASFVFLYFFGDILLEKIDRIKVKYGLIEE
ncbi:MAG: ECF transporter S component [Tissierellia bacterium]|nr:ECF transporter S component [Tissierellia bacterium]